MKSGNPRGKEKKISPTTVRWSGLILIAEDRGFEPLRDCSQPAFQASDIGR